MRQDAAAALECLLTVISSPHSAAEKAPVGLGEHVCRVLGPMRDRPMAHRALVKAPGITAFWAFLHAACPIRYAASSGLCVCEVDAVSAALAAGATLNEKGRDAIAGPCLDLQNPESLSQTRPLPPALYEAPPWPPCSPSCPSCRCYPGPRDSPLRSWAQAGVGRPGPG